MINQILVRRFAGMVKRYAQDQSSKATGTSGSSIWAAGLKPIITSDPTYLRFVNEKALFIDKTKDAYEFLSYQEPNLFIARPRRFGKSFLLDIIKNLYTNKEAKGLFAGTWVGMQGDNVWKDFENRPVIHLVMPSAGRLIEGLEVALKKRVHEATKISLDPKLAPGECLDGAIKAVKEKYEKNCVVLIDEYDRPVMDAINSIEGPEFLKKVVATMHEFYLPLKDGEYA